MLRNNRRRRKALLVKHGIIHFCKVQPWDWFYRFRSWVADCVVSWWLRCERKQRAHYQ